MLNCFSKKENLYYVCTFMKIASNWAEKNKLITLIASRELRGKETFTVDPILSFECLAMSMYYLVKT